MTCNRQNIPNTEPSVPILSNTGIAGSLCVMYYPSKYLGEHGDQVLMGRINYTGPVDVEAGLIHLMDIEDVDNGEFYYGKISKTFPIGILPLGRLGKTKVSVTPSVSVGGTDNFYGQYDLATITPGIGLNFDNEKDEPFCRVFVNFQDGKNGVDDFVYGGITFPIPIKSK